jgi:hypothetical protein
MREDEDLFFKNKIPCAINGFFLNVKDIYRSSGFIWICRQFTAHNSPRTINRDTISCAQFTAKK